MGSCQHPQQLVLTLIFCECSEHSKTLSGDSANILHHIHVVKHEWYDRQRPKEAFQKYSKYILYMLALLEIIRYRVTIAGYAVLSLSAVSASGAIDSLTNSLETVSPSMSATNILNTYKGFQVKNSRDKTQLKRPRLIHSLDNKLWRARICIIWRRFSIAKTSIEHLERIDLLAVTLKKTLWCEP